jgi:uncharacterized LabA/DUF88 family protein
MENQLAVFIDFENIAIWAEREFFDFELTQLIEYLQTRGPAVVKRAYGDWSRFHRYRDDLMNLSIDLIQIYSSKAGKNRADIRMAIDALEIAMTREQIYYFVIVSGDSDFSPLAAKLREYGRYTLGIGPRSITHNLLVKSCNEFVYLETLLGEMDEIDIQSSTERENARRVLRKALRAHGQRGEIPVLAAKLKQAMLLMDPAFNEANFGYSQFKNWLDDNNDLVKLFAKDLQLYVAPTDYLVPENLGLKPVDITSKDLEPATEISQDYSLTYQQLFNRLKMTNADMTIRRDVLRDIYRELNECPGQQSVEELLDNLDDRYKTQELIRSKSMLQGILQMGLRQKAFDIPEGSQSTSSPISLSPEIMSEADFVRYAESDFVFEVIRAGLEIDRSELACVILDDRERVDYIEELISDLKQRGAITQSGKRLILAGKGAIPFGGDITLQQVYRDIDQVKVPEGMANGVSAARSLAKNAMIQRSQDFIASANNLLLACRIQWDAVERNETGATLQDLRWYLASYASAKAGKLAQVDRDYRGARPYYLAFFRLVQEDDPLWGRMRGLINPMLAYYWLNVAREFGINTNQWNISTSSPPQIAVTIATQPDELLRDHWYEITESLVAVNPGLLKRVAEQIAHTWPDSPEYVRVAEQLQNMVS